MGQIVVSEFVSLDGVVEAPGGEPGRRSNLRRERAGSPSSSRCLSEGRHCIRSRRPRSAHAIGNGDPARPGGAERRRA